jgi:hypothetical protein
MGNDTYLITTATPSKPSCDDRYDGHRVDLLLAAKTSVPLFWFMLFQKESLVPAEGFAESGAAMPYIALSNSTAAALALARSRWPRVRMVLGAGTDDLFERWAGFVERHAAPFIHCETWELSWLTTTPRAFRSHLGTCVAAFDHVPRLQKGRPRLNRWWRELLGQCAALDREDQVRPLGDFSYCGVTYGGKNMTWSRKLYSE